MWPLLLPKAMLVSMILLLSEAMLMSVVYGAT